MSLTPVTRINFFNKSNPTVRGKKLAKAFVDNGWKVWGGHYSENKYRGQIIPEYAFNFDFENLEEFDYITFAFFENNLSLHYYQNLELKKLINLINFILNYFSKDVNFIIGCWNENIEEYTREVSKKIKVTSGGDFSESFHFPTLIKAPPSFCYIHYSLLTESEKKFLKKEWRPSLFVEMENGFFVYDKHFFESMEKGMIIGRSGYAVKRK